MNNVYLFRHCLEGYPAHCLLVLICVVLSKNFEYHFFEVQDLLWVIILFCGVAYRALNTTFSVIKAIESSDFIRLKERKFTLASKVFSLELIISAILIFLTWAVLKTIKEIADNQVDFGHFTGAVIFGSIILCYFIVHKILKRYVQKLDDSLFF